MIKISLQKSDAKKIRANHKLMKKVARQAVIISLEKATVAGQEKAVDRLMEQNVDFTGFTRKSIQRDVDRRKLEGTVQSENLEYGNAVEYGLPPGFLKKPPPYGKDSALYDWVRKKLGVPEERAWIVSKTIALNLQKNGREAKPFMRPSKKVAFQVFNSSLKKLLREYGR